MIKLSKHIYIHWLTLFIFISSYITKTLEITVLMYLAMFLHELSHTLAAIYLRLGVSRIIFYPFGVCVTLRTRVLCSTSDSIILYLSGPLTNALIAAMLVIIGKQGIFSFNNLAVFLLNLLPVLPLDGGRIIEAILMRTYGERKCRIYMNIISVLMLVFLVMFIGLFCSLNLNTLTFIIFMFGNSLMQKPKYNRDFVREISFSQKKSSKTDVLLVDPNVSEREIIKRFSPKNHTIIFTKDQNGEIINMRTDQEVIFNILN